MQLEIETPQLSRSSDRARKALRELIANRHIIYIAQDIITRAENSDVILPAALPIHQILRPKDYKIHWDDCCIAIIHREKQRVYSESASTPSCEPRA